MEVVEEDEDEENEDTLNQERRPNFPMALAVVAVIVVGSMVLHTFHKKKGLGEERHFIIVIIIVRIIYIYLTHDVEKRWIFWTDVVVVRIIYNEAVAKNELKIPICRR